MAEKLPQTLANHVRFQPPFHFFVLPVTAHGIDSGDHQRGTPLRFHRSLDIGFAGAGGRGGRAADSASTRSRPRIG